MDMSKYKSLFISDTTEHLDALEADLVQIERDPSDKLRINEIFRHMHSIKGMAGSMGYEEMARLAHRLEDMMIPHREQEKPLSGEEIDLLLRGLDEFRVQLDQVHNDVSPRPAPEELLVAADRIVTGRLLRAPPTEESYGQPGDEYQVEDGKLPVFKIELVISAQSGTPAVRAFVAYRRLSETGKIISVVPGLADLRSGRIEGRLVRLRLATDRGLAEIKRVIGTLVEVERFVVEAEDPSGDRGQTMPLEKSRSAKKPARQKPETVRVQTELLDFFVDSVGELITLRSHFEQLAERLETPALREGVRRLGKVIRKLHDRVMEIRMVPISLLTQRLPRVCRDIARSRGKQVQFEVEGEDAELDRALVEALDTPILHLLRNAVDHGIETPDQRRKYGKLPRGKIKLAVKRSSERFEIVLSDDGGGIDSSRVLSRAAEMNIPMSANPSASEALELIFRPGFSTHSGTTEISGRGVGLDVVKMEIERLGGLVSVRSEPGRGTAFILNLPLTLAILQVLLVESGGVLLALPASRVLRVTAIRGRQISDRQPDNSMSGPLIDLNGLLRDGLHARQRSPREDEMPSESVVIGRDGKAVLALAVQHVAGHVEVVLKRVGSLLARLGPFNGTTVLGDGRPVLLLDVDALIARARAVIRENPDGP
jgi:two-component system, chemotaxis family, sensor kinase CheA